YIWHNTVRQVHSPDSHQTQARRSDCQTEKCDLSLQRTCLHALESSGSMATLLLFPVAFTLFIIPLTVDRGIFSSKEIFLLHMWQPRTVPHLNLLSS
ncbi:unnamed protein product, partial [Staurois parvus]